MLFPCTECVGFKVIDRFFHMVDNLRNIVDNLRKIFDNLWKMVGNCYLHSATLNPCAYVHVHVNTHTPILPPGGPEIRTMKLSTRHATQKKSGRKKYHSQYTYILVQSILIFFQVQKHLFNLWYCCTTINTDIDKNMLYGPTSTSIKQSSHRFFCTSFSTR